MNVVFFSPLARSSAIGRVTRLVVRSLVDQGHDVVVVRSEEKGLLEAPAHDVPARVLDWTGSRPVRDAATSADAVVYQIGNHLGFHRGGLEWLARVPGIVCLHDYFLGSLFHAWARGRRSEAESVLRTWYGEAVAERYFSIDDRSFIEATSHDAPMTEWVASMATAVVTHSGWDIERVLASCAGPVRVVPLPYDLPPATGQSRKRDAGEGPDFTVLSVGHVNPNKRVASVIRAIGASDALRPVTRYRLVGRIQPDVATELRALAESLGVTLAISGEVDEDTLREAMVESDVVCSLRYPALEAASASAIEAMLYGKPVVVLDTGFYRELPDDVVRKVRVEREVPELRATLERLHAEPTARRALGDAAAAWAGRTFRADVYAETLIQLAAEVATAAPAMEASRYFAGLIGRWGGSERLLTSDLIAPLGIFQGRP